MSATPSAAPGAIPGASRAAPGPRDAASTATQPLPPLALYVHFPWCVSKCPYCDFNSHAVRGTLPEAEYVAALLEDLEAELAHSPSIARADDASQAPPAMRDTGPAQSSCAAREPRPVTSVFLGGGTPSLFSPEAIGALLAGARARLGFAADVEVTMEANPGTIERGRFAGYAAAGVNRVSLGAQSFDAATLRRLGRIHAPDDTRRAAAELHAAGLDNFNLDLMYALPGQTPEGAVADLEQALALAPAQVSHYNLTLEPGTPFAAQPPPDLPADEAVDAMLDACLARLDAAGYRRYEVSAHARPGRECRHNLNYWRFGDYLGIGAGAHGKRSRRDASGALQIERSVRLREPRRYLGARPATVTRTAVVAAQRPFEFMLNALRLVEGVELASFAASTGLGWDAVAPTVARLVERGLMADPASGRIAATPTGQRFLNDLLVDFLPAETGT